jgi:hypothetical protein
MLARVEIHTVSVPRLGYSLAEAELATGFSRSTLYRLMARGVLETKKVGKRRVVSPQALERLVEAGA